MVDGLICASTMHRPMSSQRCSLASAKRQVSGYERVLVRHRQRTGNHGHLMATGTKMLGKYLAMLKALGTDP
jgi:hypothetical protein